jgi:esterase/lipase superfamily enzyme
MSSVLWSKDIWHALRIWDGWAHDWPWWKQMIDHYIDGHD